MKQARNRSKPAGVERRELKLEELYALLEQARQSPLPQEGYEQLKLALETYALVVAELQSQRTSLARLRKLLFGAKTERTSQVLSKDQVGRGEQPGGGDKKDEADSKDEAAKGAPAAGAGEERSQKKSPGHGRNGAADYQGAQRVKLSHGSLRTGDCCPECNKGKVYSLREPAVIVRVTGMAPLSATVYERERLRCNLCGEVYTAAALEGVGEEKYDETAAAMVGLLKYGCGLPFHRLEKLQQGLGIPLPATTQWQLVSESAEKLEPAYEELIRQGAQGQVVHNDDTKSTVLELAKAQQVAAAEDGDSRKGVFTTGIVSLHEDRRIALFFTGPKHAGENLATVLEQRAAELPPPIQMCDGLSHNTSGDFDTLLANCLAHSRRKYVDIVQDFPEECRYVLETLREVYKSDGLARERNMSAEERLRFHQEQSGPLMAGLEQWMEAQFKEHKVEPNSELGKAIRYMKKHWPELTLFLRVPGAPLDNNICERALKRVILHRKNALFFKTLRGAHVSDIHMSLIHTAELNGVQPFDYLVALLRHPEQVAQAPAEWMPWNYREAMTRLQAETGLGH